MSKLKTLNEAWLNLDTLDDSELFNPFDIVKFNQDDVQY